jgi:HD superfamily phosphohydrolase
LNTSNKHKILNDPIYGFISIPDPLIFDLLEDPHFQRLRRISQMGLSYLVYPGAHHTRFHHALGCMHLMTKAVDVLRMKGVEISDLERQGLQIAILLHDIGHGPFSHAMEQSIVEGIHHEKLSLMFMESLNKKYNGSLDLAIALFSGNYHRKFFNQLIASQLDMDRLDYLKRDSFYTGVAEGSINSERMISMLHVQNDTLVIEKKGIYSVEKFLVARRLMYWQVYLHKTSFAAEGVIIRVLKRAKELVQSGIQLPCSDALAYFLSHKIGPHNFDEDTLHLFSQLDDYDVVSALKSWQSHTDFVLSSLSKMIINRQLPQIKIQAKPFKDSDLIAKKKSLMQSNQLTMHEASYFVFDGIMENVAYDKNKPPIFILSKSKKMTDVIDASDQLNLHALSKAVQKYFVCYPKGIL